MKKSLFAVGGAIAAAILMSGCAGVSSNNGGVTLPNVGPNFFSELSANAMLQPVAGHDYTIVKRNVTSSATLKGFFTCVNIGDASYATLSAEALKNVPGANGLVDVRMDYKMNCIFGINSTTVTLTGTAVRFNK